MVTPTSARSQTETHRAADGPLGEALQTLAALAIDTAVRLGVSTWVISPGSRSAPLTAALAARTDVTRYVVLDERSAGYIALGLAQQLRAPVGLVCTSGTATLNYGPAIAEALHQAIALLVLTADRPAEWIDQQDNQALRQNALYGQNVRASFALPLDDGHPDTRWHAVRTVADALQVATAQPNGPVHINVPLREPLYAPSTAIERPEQVAKQAPTIVTLPDTTWDRLVGVWRAAQRILIVGGPNPPDARLQRALRTLLASDSVAAIGDVTANIAGVATAPGWDAALGTRDAGTLDTLRADLVINFGGAVTSRGLKALLRSRPPREFWRLGPGLPAPDTYQSMTHAIPMGAADFLNELAERTLKLDRPASGYATSWRALGDMASTAVDAAHR